jgi:hypothetical protein
MPGHNNWLEINLQLGQDNHQVQFEACAQLQQCKQMEFDQASDYTADLIAKRYTNLHVSLSGGLDSEYVCRVLMRNQIPFVPVIVLTPISEPEVWTARHFCHEQGLTPVILDYRSCYEHLLDQVLKEARAVRCDANVSFFPHIVAQHIANQGGALLTGYGDPFPVSNDYTQVVGDALALEEHDFYLDVSLGQNNPGGFFSYTPEIFCAMARSINTACNIQLAKSQLYNIAGRSKIVIGNIGLPPTIRNHWPYKKSHADQCIDFSRSWFLDQVGSAEPVRLRDSKPIENITQSVLQ